MLAKLARHGKVIALVAGFLFSAVGALWALLVTDRIGSVWPNRRRIVWPEPVSQNRKVQSSLAETTVFSSGATALGVLDHSSLGPPKACPSLRSQTRRESSALPEIAIRASGVIPTAFTASA